MLSLLSLNAALLQYDKTHAATIARGRVVSTVMATAAKTVSNVATNKALMALARGTDDCRVSHQPTERSC